MMPGRVVLDVKDEARETLEELNEAIIACRRCPRLVRYRETVARQKVARFRDWEYWGRPVPGFGDPGARVLVVGLAPAAHGGNRTGRVFTGDRSGDWLYRALFRAGFANQSTSVSRTDGLELADVYVAAAVRCAPPGNRPTPSEFRACGPYLARELQVLTGLRVVVALGHVAMVRFLRAWQDCGGSVPVPRPAFAHGGTWSLGRVTLLTSYHPSQRNTQTGLLSERMFDGIFRKTRELLDEPGGPRPRKDPYK
jgi:uracil-DNA glycosylase family 4